MGFRRIAGFGFRRAVPVPILALVTIFTMGLDPAPHDDQAPRIAVLESYEAPPYQEALRGFQKFLDLKGAGASYDVYSLKGNVDDVHQAVDRAKQEGARLIFTVGGLATEFALKEAPDIPIVACMILNSNDLKGAANATGVVLEFPLETEVEWMINFMPNHKTIGVLFNPKENGEKIEEATKIVRSRGRKLYAQEVDQPQDLPDALNRLSRNADVLWGIPDHVVLSPETARPILLFSFRNRIPFTGLSESWVKAGALYSLDRDYTDLGAQCGEMALKILKGVRADSIPPAHPRKVLYSLNLKTAEEMKLNIPETLIRGAAQVFR